VRRCLSDLPRFVRTWLGMKVTMDGISNFRYVRDVLQHSASRRRQLEGRRKGGKGPGHLLSPSVAVKTSDIGRDGVYFHRGKNSERINEWGGSELNIGRLT
jgi:hypothetical protein